MHYFLLGFIAVNTVLFSVLAYRLFRFAKRGTSRTTRRLALALGTLASLVIVGNTQRLGFQLILVGWLPRSFEPFLLGGWQLLLSVTTAAAGIVGLVLVRPLMRSIAKNEHMVEVLTDRLPPDVDISQLGLTARELEVLEVIAQGNLSDDRIAQGLYVSPATAGTHVRNILKKAGLHNRKDLLLLTHKEHPRGSGVRAGSQTRRA